MTPRRIDLSACHVALVLNRASGRGDAEDRIAKIRDKIVPRAARFSLHAAGAGGEIAAMARAARDSGADVVAVLGGDGTQSAVAGALAGSDTVMAVLPGGTFNYFARGLGVGEEVEQALDTLLGGRAARIDLAEVNGRVFLNNASFGAYPAILERRESIYRRWGRSRIAAYWSVLVTLLDLRHPMLLTVTTGGETRVLHTPLAFAARSAYQLESFGLGGAEAVEAGHFALFLARAHGRAELVAAALKLAFGTAVRGQDFEMVVADEIVIETSRAERLLAFDGERAPMRGPYRLRMRRDDLWVMVPEPPEAPEAPAA